MKPLGAYNGQLSQIGHTALLDTIMYISQHEAHLYYSNGRIMRLYSSHGAIISLLDWFLAPNSNFSTYSAYLAYEAEQQEPTQPIAALKPIVASNRKTA